MRTSELINIGQSRYLEAFARVKNKIPWYATVGKREMLTLRCKEIAEKIAVMRMEFFVSRKT